MTESRRERRLREAAEQALAADPDDAAGVIRPGVTPAGPPAAGGTAAEAPGEGTPAVPAEEAPDAAPAARSSPYQRGAPRYGRSTSGPSAPYETSPYAPRTAPHARPGPALGDVPGDVPRDVPGDVPRDVRGLRRLLHLAVLPAVGVLLLAWALTTLVGDLGPGPLGLAPVAFACLSPLIVVPAVPVAFLAVQRRRWATLVLPVAAAAVPWTFVVGYALPAAPPAGATVPLRAMIVTARDGRADARDIVAAVLSQRVDLLVVLELTAQLSHDLTTAGLPIDLTARYVSVPDPGAAPTGIGIYSRFGVDRVTPLRGPHWPAVTAVVTVGPTPVTLVAGHAVPPSPGRLDVWQRDLAAFRTAERIKGPVLMLADLNATPWNPQFRWMVSGRLHDAADVLGQGLRPTWPAWTPVPLLAADHALVAGLGVSDVTALPVDGSDHRALSVGLAVPAGAR